MAKETAEFVLLKLRSGDEIVARKSGTSPQGLSLSRPLQLQRSTMLDPHTGEIKRNICVLRDWLEFTTSVDCNIPHDFIIVQSKASPDLIKRYMRELNALDTPSKGKPVPPAPPTTSPAVEKKMEEFFRNMGLPSPPSTNSNPQGLPENPFSGMMGDLPQDRVTVNISMPMDAFLSLAMNLPLFEMGQDGPMDEFGDGDDDLDFDGDDEDSHPKEPTTPPPPKPRAKKKKPDSDEPPEFPNRFGFPK